MLGVIWDILPWRHSLLFRRNGGLGLGHLLGRQAVGFGLLSRGIAITTLVAIRLTPASRRLGPSAVGSIGSGVGITTIWAIDLVVVALALESNDRLPLLG